MQALEKEAETGAALDQYEVEGPDRAEILTNLGEFQLAVVSKLGSTQTFLLEGHNNYSCQVIKVDRKLKFPFVGCATSCLLSHLHKPGVAGQDTETWLLLFQVYEAWQARAFAFACQNLCQ